MRENETVRPRPHCPPLAELIYSRDDRTNYNISDFTLDSYEHYTFAWHTPKWRAVVFQGVSDFGRAIKDKRLLVPLRSIFSQKPSAPQLPRSLVLHTIFRLDVDLSNHHKQCANKAELD